MLVETRTKSRLSLEQFTHDTLKLARIWEKVTENSCPHQYNFHLHTNCSDGQLSPELLMEQAISLKLKGFAITDHHSVSGFYRAKKWLEKKHSSSYKNYNLLPRLWSGIEITSVLNGTNVHILGYGFDTRSIALQQYLTGESPTGELANAKNVITALHEAGALVVLAHPFRYRRNARELIYEANELGIDGIEAYYAYGHAKPWQASKKQTSVAKQIASQYKLYTTCGTDSHGNSILVRV